MSSYSFKLPDIGEGIAEAEVVTWHVPVGDFVEEDAPLADLMTDKATVEMTAPIAGKLVSRAAEVGEMVAIGAVLAIFQVEDGVGNPAEPAHDAPEQRAGPHTVTEPESRAASPNETATERRATHASDPVARQESETGQRRVLASPAVRKRAKNLGIDLADVQPMTEGRVRHSDLDVFLTYNADGGYVAQGVERPDEHVKVIGLRRRIAENMAASKRHIPHFSYIDEMDVTKLEALRADLNAARGAKPKVTLLPLLITALCRTLPDYPMLNARYDDDQNVVTCYGAVHLGIATQTDNGLMVPVIRNAEGQNIWQLAAEISRLADAARTGKAKAEDLSGSTLTLTSLGPLGGIATTPVINRPEVAIIGPNKVVERPVVRDGKFAIAKMMNISISCDHRVVDGWHAASFVQALKHLLETPALLFVD